MIKVLTLLGNNYGGCLQAVALHYIIKKEGKKVSQINYTEYIQKGFNIKSFIKDIIYLRRNFRFFLFKQKYLNIGKKVNRITDDGSIYVVGSDQVWNPNIPINIRKNFYLEFVKEKSRKNAYAASIGDNKIDSNENNKNKIINFLKEFNYIYVREKTAENLINKIAGNISKTVLDPTLLLTTEEWNKFKAKTKKKEKYLLVYTLGLNKNCEQYIDKFSKKIDLKIIDIFYRRRFKNLLKKENGYGPGEFISGIANSDFVITNSFHGMVFSIIYRKNFIVITRGNMSSRIYDLLSTLGLKDRIINENEINEIESYIELDDIDYDKVYKILSLERKKSLDCIKKIINVKN